MNFRWNFSSDGNRIDSVRNVNYECWKLTIFFWMNMNGRNTNERVFVQHFTKVKIDEQVSRGSIDDNGLFVRPSLVFK